VGCARGVGSLHDEFESVLHVLPPVAVKMLISARVAVAHIHGLASNHLADVKCPSSSTICLISCRRCRVRVNAYAWQLQLHPSSHSVIVKLGFACVWVLDVDLFGSLLIYAQSYALAMDGSRLPASTVAHAPRRLSMAACNCLARDWWTSLCTRSTRSLGRGRVSLEDEVSH
jgi:hypothetical protein